MNHVDLEAIHPSQRRALQSSRVLRRIEWRTTGRGASACKALACKAVACAVLLLPVTAAAAPATYAIDPVHTRVQFAISHAGFSQAIGTVSGSSGTLVFDPDDWSTARLQVSVPMDRIDMGDAAWNKAVLAGNLLDAADHPQAIFTSTQVVPVDATHAHVTGTLELHGVAREVVLDVTFNQLKRHPLPPFRRTAGFSATTTLSRKDFGITAWSSVIGDVVQLRIEAEATRARTADADADAGTEDSAGSDADAHAATQQAPTTGDDGRDAPVDPDAPTSQAAPLEATP